MTEGGETSEVNAEGAPGWRFLALSLRDGLDAERIYHRTVGLDRGNSTFWQRCRAAWAESGFHHVTAYNIGQEVMRLRRPFDEEQRNLDRFLHALRTGQIDAIGYLPPRAPDALPVLIPARIWDQCQIDWERAEIAVAGLVFADVRILISALVFDSNHLFYGHQAVTLLAPFPSSDDKRKQLGILSAPVPESITVEAGRVQASDSVAQGKSGRPSLRDDIVAAFEAIQKDPNWTDKQFAQAIRDHVKTMTGKHDDKGLGDDAILKHLRSVWLMFRRPSS